MREGAPVAREPHKLAVVGSIPTPATKFQRKPKTKKDKAEAREEKQRNCTAPVGPGLYCPKCDRRH